MRYIFRITYCFIFLFVLTTGTLFAQNCENKLLKAQDMYSVGKLENIDVLILTCLHQGGFALEERILALELLINTELTRDNITAADNYTIQLLNQNPLFKPSENDTPEFKYYFAKFRTNPVARLGIEFGANSSNNNILTNESIGNNLDKNFETTSALGISVSGIGCYVINKNFEITSSLKLNLINTNMKQLLKTTRFGITTDLINSSNFNSNYNYSQLDISESYLSISLPIGLTYGMEVYTRHSDKITEFTINSIAGAGITFHYILNHSFNYTRSSVGSSSNVQRPISGATLDFINQNIRHPYYTSAYLNLGLRLISYSAIVQLLFQYSYGIQSLNNNNNKVLQNDITRELLFKYGYLENEITINQLSVQISYLRSIFKPKKIYK